MKNIFLFVCCMLHAFIFAMDLDIKKLSQSLQLSEQAIIKQEEERVLVAEIQHRYNKKKNSTSNYLRLLYAPIDPDKMIFEKCIFLFPGKKILPCGGTLYSTTKNDIFYQIAVELSEQEYEGNFRLVKKDISVLNNEKYIIECGFSSLLNNSSRHDYLLFLDIDIDDSHSYTNLIDFI